MFTNKKREDINTFVCAVTFCVVETPKASKKDHEPSLPRKPFGIVADLQDNLSRNSCKSTSVLSQISFPDWLTYAHYLFGCR